MTREIKSGDTIAISGFWLTANPEWRWWKPWRPRTKLEPSTKRFVVSKIKDEPLQSE